MTSNYACFYFVTKANVLMKFPKEIRQYMWDTFEAKEKLRDKLFEERWRQKEICEKIMNNDFAPVNTSDFALMNLQSKNKMFKTLKTNEKRRNLTKDQDTWKGYIENFKNETKIKSLRKLIAKKSNKNSLKFNDL